MRALLQMLRDRRGEERVAALIDAQIEHGGVSHSAVVMDISHRGFRMMVDGHLPVGAAVSLRIARLPVVAAETIWVAGMVVGCQFRQPLSAAALEAILRQALG